MGLVTRGTTRKGIGFDWTPEEGEPEEVQLFFINTLDENDVHNSGVVPNDGHGGVWVPADHTGSFKAQVRTVPHGEEHGTVLHEGVISA